MSVYCNKDIELKKIYHHFIVCLLSYIINKKENTYLNFNR